MAANISERRCDWANDPLYVMYHDNEWGTPTHNETRLFEFIALEGMQAGLSWITILRKRKNFNKAFDNFNYNKVAKYDGRKIATLLKDQGIIRNRMKIVAIIENAKAFMAIQKKYGSFDSYIWKFAPKRMSVRYKLKDLPAESAESREMSKSLKEHGFRFVGPTTCYAFMQATGMVNDHLNYCFKRSQMPRR